MHYCLKFWAKQICILLTLCGFVTSLPLLILFVSGKYLEKAPYICGYFSLAGFLIFGSLQCYNVYRRNG